MCFQYLCWSFINIFLKITSDIIPKGHSGYITKQRLRSFVVHHQSLVGSDWSVLLPFLPYLFTHVLHEPFLKKKVKQWLLQNNQQDGMSLKILSELFDSHI